MEIVLSRGEINCSFHAVVSILTPIVKELFALHNSFVIIALLREIV